MTSEQTGGSTVGELMDENANLKADYAVACDTADRQAYEINKQDATIATLTADNERLSARVERLEAVSDAADIAKIRLEVFADEANAGAVHYSARELKRKIWGAFSQFDEARRELEEGK